MTVVTNPDQLKNIELTPADSLAALAHKYLGDVSSFRDLADLNNIDIFSIPNIGSTIKIPTTFPTQTSELNFKTISEKVKGVSSLVDIDKLIDWII